MAKFLILIYGDEQRWENASDIEMSQIDAGHSAFRTKASEAILASGQLQPSNTAVSLRAGASDPLITDGPFIESKDRDEAISLASGLAEVSHDHSGVVVHPLVA